MHQDVVAIWAKGGGICVLWTRLVFIIIFLRKWGLTSDANSPIWGKNKKNINNLLSDGFLPASVNGKGDN